MRNRRYLIYLVVIILISGCSSGQKRKDNWPVLKGPYLGQKPPGLTPEIFAPGIVSTGFLEQFAYFTPDGKELYWLLRGAPHTVVCCMKEANGKWLEPEVAPFSGRYFAKFCLSPEGNRVVLTSSQPRSGRGNPTDVLTTWIVERTDTGWSDLQLIDVLEEAAAPTMASNGNLYFYLDLEDERDIYVSECSNGAYTEPMKLGNAINTEFDEVDPFIAPNESYILYGASGPNGDGLYISFRNQEGLWMKAINMSESTDIPSDANCPSVTRDGKYLFFTSFQRHFKNYSDRPITYEEKVRILNSPGNGNADIYWMDAGIIETYRPRHPGEMESFIRFQCF